ncbi:hypothetical protein [Rhodococcus sp. IEGM 1379]|uniref:hypothetical protein n=1 Tax=Rhodococcus sp. IEGM 1379 TaxID=3047086 RepID=UPI0024B676D0|nr:hypothetical protein [Rhodococcus sp. IEGM 1379]MDI9918636.1 hypothetical protein [Rhodococcus sp. IEGM 1379]
MNILSAKAFHRVTQLVTVTVLAVNAVLLAIGVLAPRQALYLFVAVELPLALLVMLGFAATFRVHRRSGIGRSEAVSATFGDSPFWPMIRAEIRAYTSLWFWARGRDTGIEPGGLAFRSSRGSLVLPAAFGVATLMEIGVLHFVLPWMWLRVVLAVLSVWSLLALLGYLAVHRVHPHYLTDSHFVVRQSGTIVASIHRSDITSAALSRRLAETNPIIVEDRLYLPNMDGTNVDIVLTQPISIQLPAMLPRHRKTSSVDYVSVYVDDPAALVTELRKNVLPALP